MNSLPTSAFTEDCIKLPAGRFFLRCGISGILTGVIWGLAAWAGWGREDLFLGALLAGLGASLAAFIPMTALRIWVPRPLVRWPFIILAITMLQTLLTLGVGFVLHFAILLGAISTWLCLVVSYWIVLSVLTGTYARAIKQLPLTSCKKA